MSVPGAVATGSKPNLNNRVAIIRVEQFYPFPQQALKAVTTRYSPANDLVWCQEEPKNMGAWTFMEGKFEDLIPRGDLLRYIGRAESASPATGNYSVHVQEQERLVHEALTIAGSDSGGAGATAKGDATHGEKLFTATCVTCHGPDARGVKGLGKSLVDSTWLKKASDTDVTDLHDAHRHEVGGTERFRHGAVDGALVDVLGVADLHDAPVEHDGEPIREGG